jgi:dihydrofolate reductase
MSGLSTGGPHFQAIAAMAPNRVIGCENQIPWHLPEDFKWFKKKTMGHDLVMGRRTFESIGRPLPGRQTMVLSRAGFSSPGVAVFQSLSELPEAEEGRLRFICGGAEIYRLALPLCSDLFLTRVKKEVEGDCFFPVFEDSFERLDVIDENDDFVIEHHRRIDC